MLLNLSVRLPCDAAYQMRNLSFVGQLFSKSRGRSVVCGRIIEGKVLELYQELTDSPTNSLEEVCVLSAIFALRYLSRDLAANVESVDVRFRRSSVESLIDGLILDSTGVTVMKSGGRIHPRSLPRVRPSTRIHRTRRILPSSLWYLIVNSVVSYIGFTGLSSDYQGACRNVELQSNFCSVRPKGERSERRITRNGSCSPGADP